MATVKNGVNYEITANDKASKVLENSTKKVEKATKEAGDAFKGEFNPMSAVMAGVSGSIEGVSQQLLGLVSRLKGVHMSMMRFGLYAALIMTIIKTASVLIDHFGKLRIAAETISLKKSEKSLAKIEKAQVEWNKELDGAIDKTARIKNNLLADLSATEKLSNAQHEYNKQLELSLAKTEKEKAAIERKYAAIKDQESGSNALITINAERNELEKNISLWKKAISKYKKDNKALNKEYSKNYSLAKEKQAEYEGSTLGYVGILIFDDVEIAKKAAKLATKAKNKRNSNKEEIAKLEIKIEESLKKLDRLKIDEERIKVTMKSDAVKADTAEKDAVNAEAEEKKKAEEEAKAKAEAEADAILKEEQRLAAEHDKAMRKAAEDEAKAIKAARLKADKEVMAERKRRLTELTTMESDAAKRLAAAQSKVAEAWAWYRDKDKMAAQLKEEKAEEAAQKQFEKDFEDLKWRRDWRTAKDLSVDQEAVRRVALAKEEETAAQKALAETAKSTAQAAASLAEIEKVITQEG